MILKIFTKTSIKNLKVLVSLKQAVRSSLKKTWDFLLWQYFEQQVRLLGHYTRGLQCLVNKDKAKINKRLLLMKISYNTVRDGMPLGNGKCRSTDNTKLGIKRGNSYRKQGEISGWKAQINTRKLRTITWHHLWCVQIHLFSLIIFVFSVFPIFKALTVMTL